MTTPRHTVRYAAKAAYQLSLMRGLYTSHQCKMLCEVHGLHHYVIVHTPEGEQSVPIAKAWASL